MPAAVEVSDRAGQIGVVEVLRQTVPQHPGKADRHQGVGLPLDEELNAEAERAEPGQRDRKGLKPDGDQLVPEDCELVRDKDLHRKAEHEILQPSLQGGQAGFGPIQLCAELVVAGDRAHQELGVEDGEIGKAHRIVFRFETPPPNVHQIGDEGEGIEADANRQDAVELEGCQRQNVDCNRSGNGCLGTAGSLDADAEPEVDCRKEQRPERAGDGVEGHEDHAARKQQIAPVFFRTQAVQRQKRRKEPQKGKTGKVHRQIPLLGFRDWTNFMLL